MRLERKSYRHFLPRAVFMAPLVAFLLAACSSRTLSADKLMPADVGNAPGTTKSSASPAATKSTGSPRATTSKSGSKWVLSWEDDFKGTGSPPGWIYDTGGYGFGNKQLQWNSNQNAQMSKQGGLTISATKGGGGHTCWYGLCKYQAAKIQTSFAQTYGRFEARIKLPAGAGLWPAFWMIPASGETAIREEIDIIEVNNKEPYLVKGYVHDSSVFNYGARKVINLPISSEFHVYGIDWTPSGITWTLDGKPYGHIKAYPNWPFNQPFVMVLDLAVGGEWPGPPNANTVFPGKLQVSWIRVYKWAS